VTWTVNLQTRTGGALSTNVPLAALRAVWSLDGPGAFEAEIGEDNAAAWLPGQRRVVLLSGGVAKWAGFLTEMTESTQSFDDLSRPAGTELRASALGFSSVLANRVVHGDFSRTATVATTIAWNLVQEAQGQTNGDYSFTLGTITGTAPARTRDYCDGDNIADAINELAAMSPGGFDWDISETGAFRAWVGGRGVASGETLTRAETRTWDVGYDTTEMATYVTALGEADEPCGAPLVIRSSGLGATYGRVESVDDRGTNNIAELTEVADEELRGRLASRLRVSATWSESQAPWAWGTVWLGDTLSVTLPTHFGGTQTMRVIEISLSVEPPAFGYITYELETTA
jgi:hypothetical protein